MQEDVMRKIDFLNIFERINRAQISQALLKIDMSLNKKKSDEVADHLLLNNENVIQQLQKRGI